MPEENPEPNPPAAPRRRGLTPELRRFLNTPRATPAEGDAKTSEPPKSPPPPSSPPGDTPHQDPARPAATPMAAAEKASRVIELQHAVLVLGAILLVALAFFLGTKFNRLKYLVASRNKPTLAEMPDKFPGVAAADLVRQALSAERMEKWEDAIERFMAAKKKDLRYRGILFRVGKILYDHRNFDSADTAFERAIAFGEDVEAANFYRGLIAVRRRDLPAAERFFEAAATAVPFVPDYQYYWGESLRLDFKPAESLSHYNQARLLARTKQDETVCEFKIRMARLEAAQSPEVSAELAKKEAAGPLSVDWLMTAAALALRSGQIQEARQRIMKAREGNSPGLFASCVNDLAFHDAAKKYPELAEALHLEVDLQVDFGN